MHLFRCLWRIFSLTSPYNKDEVRNLSLDNQKGADSEKIIYIEKSLTYSFIYLFVDFRPTH